MSQVPSHAEAAGTGQPDTAARCAPAQSRRLTATGLVILVATVVGLGLRVLQLSRPGALLGVTEYDDGVYFGSAIRLVDGVIPYRDFVLVQPPGLVLLMTPIAALSKLTGSAWGMGLGRILTLGASTASIPLAGLLVRRRGVLAVMIACGIMTVYPDAILAAHTVLQEPWLVLFCLIGLLAVFDDERLTSSGRRLAWGGVAFGFAGAVKLWAIFPIVVLAVMCAPSLRRAAIYLGGVAAGFLVPVLPFLAMAPSSFYRGVVLAQLVRVDDTRTTLKTRLADLSGLGSSAHISKSGTLLVTAVIIVVIAVSCVAASVMTRRLPPPLEWFALVTGGIVFLSFLWPVDFYYHYAGFFTPFLALAVALPVARLATALQGTYDLRSHGVRLELGAVVVAAIALAAMTGVQAHSEAVAKGAKTYQYVKSIIPPGACVLTDEVSLTIAVGRFTSDVPGCPQVVDGDGTDLDFSEGHNGVSGAARNHAVQAVWDSAFRKAQYVWLSSGDFRGTAARRIAWTPALEAYFTANFRPVPGHPLIFKRI